MTSQQYLLVLEVLVALIGSSMRVALGGKTLSAMLRGFERGAGSAADSTVGDQFRPVAAPVGQMVSAVARRVPWHPKCLAQAIAASTLLRRRSIPHELRLGVQNARLDGAHAWVTVNGRAVIGGASAAATTTVAVFHSGGGRRR